MPIRQTFLLAKFSIVLVALSASLCSSSSKVFGAEPYAGANNDLTHAQQAMVERNWDRVVFFTNEAIGGNTNDPKMYFMRGRAHFHLQHWELAIQDFNEVLRLSPNYFAAFMWRGSAHGKVGTDDLAIKDYEQAIRLNPKLATRYFNSPGLHSGRRQSAGVIAALRYHIPGVVAEDLKSPLVLDYKHAMSRVYPDGWSANAPKRVGESNPGTYATDADDEAYMSELAAGGVPRQGGPAKEENERASIVTTQTNGQSGDQPDDRSTAKRRKRGKNAASNASPSTVGESSSPGASSPSDRGTYHGLADNPAASKTTNISGNLDIGRSDDLLDARKNRRVVTNTMDRDADFGEFGAVPGSQPLKGDAKVVLQNCNEALRQDGHNCEYYYLRAKAYQKLGKVDDAYRDYKSAIDINPDCAKYYIGRASMFYQLKKPLLVDADVRRALNCDQSLPHKIHFGGDFYPKTVKWTNADEY